MQSKSSQVVNSTFPGATFSRCLKSLFMWCLLFSACVGSSASSISALHPSCKDFICNHSRSDLILLLPISTTPSTLLSNVPGQRLSNLQSLLSSKVLLFSNCNSGLTLGTPICNPCSSLQFGSIRSLSSKHLSLTVQSLPDLPFGTQRWTHYSKHLSLAVQRLPDLPNETRRSALLNIRNHREMADTENLPLEDRMRPAVHITPKPQHFPRRVTVTHGMGDPYPPTLRLGLTEAGHLQLEHNWLPHLAVTEECRTCFSSLVIHSLVRSSAILSLYVHFGSCTIACCAHSIVQASSFSNGSSTANIGQAMPTHVTLQDEPSSHEPLLDGAYIMLQACFLFGFVFTSVVLMHARSTLACIYDRVNSLANFQVLFEMHDFAQVEVSKAKSCGVLFLVFAAFFAFSTLFAQIGSVVSLPLMSFAWIVNLLFLPSAWRLLLIHFFSLFLLLLSPCGRQKFCSSSLDVFDSISFSVFSVPLVLFQVGCRLSAFVPSFLSLLNLFPLTLFLSSPFLLFSPDAFLFGLCHICLLNLHLHTASLSGSLPRIQFVTSGKHRKVFCTSVSRRTRRPTLILLCCLCGFFVASPSSIAALPSAYLQIQESEVKTTYSLAMFAVRTLLHLLLVLFFRGKFAVLFSPRVGRT